METQRLTFRRWTEDDASECYRYASDPALGYPAGWPTHITIEDSLRVIRENFARPETYAVVLKATGLPIGCIGFMLGESSTLAKQEGECELGYWLGVPYWGQGLMTEAAREMLRHAFEGLGMQRVWCAYYDGNERSRRVQEKCGFRYQKTIDSIEVPLLHEIRKCHVNCLTREEWEQERSLRAHQ